MTFVFYLWYVFFFLYTFAFAEINVFDLISNDFIGCSEKRFAGSWNDSS